MLLAHVRWPDVEAYAARSAGVIVPIGSTEQHGPNGLIGTDALCADAIAREVADRCNALVTPPINVGMATYHMSFPGSLTLRPSTLTAVVCDLVASLARHGLTSIFFLNGHGGNVPVLHSAFCEAYYVFGDIITGHGPSGKGGGRLRCHLHNWWQGADTSALSAMKFGEHDGIHATASEISVVQHLHRSPPVNALDPQRAPVSEFYGAADFRSRFPDGRIGSDPSLASADHGADLFHAAVSDARDAYKRFLAN